MLENRKYYVLEDDCLPYVFNGFYTINVPYYNNKKIFFNTEYYTEIFAEYKKIKEPMLFNSEKKEQFTGFIVEGSPLHMSFHHFFYHEADYRKPENYSSSLNFSLNNKHDCIFASKNIRSYPFIHGPSYDDRFYREIEGTELKELLISISDTPNATSIYNLTFNRHKNTLNNLFENACNLADFGYKNFNQFLAIAEEEKRFRNQKENRNYKDDTQAKLFLNNYRNK